MFGLFSYGFNMKTTVEVYHVPSKHGEVIRDNIIIPKEGERLFLYVHRSGSLTKLIGTVSEVQHEIGYFNSEENSQYIKIFIE